jgi:uncharacterized membrane protein SirB2
MMYILVKYLHVSTVLISFTLFFVRGIWMLRESPILQKRWVKIVPHLVDTTLLLSAMTLAVMLTISPFSSAWLMAKIAALLLYIVLGTIGLKRGKSKQTRVIAWLAALFVFVYIVLVALTHSALLGLA